MSGYAASARIRGARPRLADPASIDPGRGASSPGGAVAPEIVPLERHGRPTAGRALADRWDAIRERCSQLTFYLCDPQSWR